MGTNFYWAGYATGNADGDDDRRYDTTWHIGKRSAAGWYCYDCRVALVEGGERNVHLGARSLDACPQCGKTPQPQGHNAVLVELGFQQTAQQALAGVQGASSFSWAQSPDEVTARCNEHLWDECIEDEYGRRYTGQQFLWMLEVNCPIRFTESIGRAFS